MSNFCHWAIAHGVAYDRGLILRYKLIIRQSTFDKLYKNWSKAIIWC